MKFEELYKKYNTSKEKIEHMKVVTQISLLIADMLDLQVDKKLLAQSSLLHDLGSSFYKNKPDLNDFDLVWGHQVKTREILSKLGHARIADVASRHNYNGLTVKESKKWGYKKGVNLMLNSNESKILAFADAVSFFLRKNKEYTHKIIDKDYRYLLKKYGMLRKAENRAKKTYNFLLKHGFDYEKLLKQLV
jgi:HD superfamily phosphodiesterase